MSYLSDNEIGYYIEKFGKEAVLSNLRKLEESRNDEYTLTIVSNKGSHHIPSELMMGKIYYASEGNLDFSSQSSVLSEYDNILSDLAKLIKSKEWKKIYLIPFGHATLSMQIKLLIYRICSMETIDWFYNPEFGYVPLEIRIRDIIVGSE